MPFHIKFGLSIIVLLVTAAGYALQAHLGQTTPKYAVAFLGLFMVVAMWVFPEVERKKIDRR
ncbi:MAG: hypothetical protein B7Y12_10950 [Rhizobiales bacterium 24-66-13]|jgi:hypothetical protein|uniref:hypothetical protein n=1 Tax=Roseixanthobacter TaxID=3462307 RepID=UPI000BD1D2C2|nr:MAG: hypothetical protein B7Z41_03035 [Rhizobiales bacterium 12-66-7]OYX75222.1 MAG: hypothetical protein B7Y95_03635 [Rhizobiales bacterium 32-66-11]OYY62426.1 MAG: hypothetical protein B7Y61_22390 [Rhizobiales bacterium 35-66-30]OYZ76998.1 MAG: hypothetical protein B7Y12_10950 [Rhizobiales bacterium 24-66-13]OZB03069.1 MAG: hypothetical protein B7X67_18140 [Rhizobiales bacterium 39-66-18]HQS07691.1 hypothetical protein [Xanthobacteraceae bacterium]